MSATVDPIDLASALIRCPSVTPRDEGALDVLAAALEKLGFTCHRLRFEADGTDPVDNLYARLGTGQPNFCYAGHTDVVPVGDAADWDRDPFAGEVIDGVLHGRGASDMKGGIAAFVAAVSAFLDARGSGFAGSISLLITGDEEGPAINGTRKVLDWMAENLADNPASRLVRMLAAVIDHPLDAGTEHFQPTNLEVSSIDIGNPATNVIPAKATARFNIRFNDTHTSDSLLAWLRERFAAAAGDGARWTLDHHVTGEAFLTPPGALSDLIAGAVETVTGRRPELSTTGGTSDARFIKDVCPVAEFGLVGQTMHKVDERVAVAEIEQLTEIYRVMLERYFDA
jgi:succinyl-diaminopimelate desuccinylase